MVQRVFPTINDEYFHSKADMPDRLKIHLVPFSCKTWKFLILTQRPNKTDKNFQLENSRASVNHD